MVNYFLHNPVYNALCSGDQSLSYGTDKVKYFNEQVSPFAGFEDSYKKGFEELYELLPPGRKILYANPDAITLPAGWQLQHEIKGLQFIYDGEREIKNEFPNVYPLNKEHISQMIELATLTRPGPFGQGTINFGFYFGIFENGKLVAMTGQRLHVQKYSEISAVCTHPDFLGKGYAFTLLKHQLCLMMQQGRKPFLHVREDNERAIGIYNRLGFIISRQMNFYFFKRM